VAVCRICGADCAPDELLQETNGCRRCNGSPACARCGHARRHHRGTFGGGQPSCTARVAADVGLALGRCGCAGYTTEAEAYVEPVELVEVTELRLRRPGDPPASEETRLAPVRDLFDEGRRLRGHSEPGGLPWRPPA
jgi:hypothetical protein